ncbi:MAG: peptidoglycan recognition protein family protein [Candidatus Peribacteria bacterium]|nr:peptidoglycan recognition protein family protein [Candidatus Peribacteria bacterium]
MRLLNLKATNPTAYQAELKKREQAQATAAKNAKISAERTVFMKKNFPNDWTYDLTRDKQGEYYLLYQDQIKNHKTKLVVHHTAMEYDTHRTEAEIRASLQRIYTYHTIDRDFGDIGYNFLIDHLGNIYEGRAGGEGAVGMHVAYNNIASVGISLMGNFEETQPTQAQIDALTDLLTALAKKYHIDPNAQESYFQPSSSSPYMTVKTLPTIVGHGDIAPTACPGEHLHILLPFIRTEVSKRLQGNSPSEIFSRDGEIAVTPDLSVTSLSDFSAKLKKIQTTQPELLKAVVQVVRDRYQGTLPKATNGMEKLAYKWTLDVLKNIFWSTSDEIPSGIPVLLYELTTQYKTYEVKCETSSCFVDIDHQLTHF